MNNETSRIKKAEDLFSSYKTQYAEDGYVIIRDLLDSQTLSELQSHIEWLNRKYPDRKEVEDHELVKNDPFWLSIAGYPPFLDVAE